MYVGDHILESICKRGSYYTEFGLVLTVLTCLTDVSSMRVSGWESPFDAFFWLENGVMSLYLVILLCGLNEK